MSDKLKVVNVCGGTPNGVLEDPPANIMPPPKVGENDDDDDFEDDEDTDDEGEFDD